MQLRNEAATHYKVCDDNKLFERTKKPIPTLIKKITIISTIHSTTEKEEIIIFENIGKLSEDTNSLTGTLISHIKNYKFSK